MSVQISFFENINREKQAIDRIKIYAPIALELTEKPFYVTYSGGKDSDVIRILCELAGVKYDLVHNHTTVDAPETVYYIRSIPNVQIEYPRISMWNLIVKKKFLPTRVARYCCSELKERGGKDRFIMTGVRWAESPQRKTRGTIEIQGKSKKDAIVLNSDNDESRRQFETCLKKGKRILNPIIDWSDNDVWDFLNHYGCKSNPLYERGHSRVGCIGCPLASNKARIREFEEYPKYKNAYIKAFDRMLKERLLSGRTPEKITWTSGEDAFARWMNDIPMPKPLAGQMSMFDDKGDE